MNNSENFKIVDTQFNGVYIGCVEDNNDPEKMGRVRVRILGIHTDKKTKNETEGIPTNELPWALPLNPIMGGGVTGLGLNGVPVNGSWVALFFIGGCHGTPAYFGTFSGFAKTSADTKKGFNDPDGIYPKEISTPNWNKYARGSVVDHGAAVGSEPANPAAPEYPFNTVLETPDNGIIVEHDSTPGKERWHVFHKASKSYMQIGPDGTTTFKSAKDNYEIIVSNNTVHIGGNESKTVVGNENKTVSGNEVENVTGTLTIIVNGKVILKGKGTVEIYGSDGGTLGGVVNQQCLCPLLGSGHVQYSANTKVTLA